MRKTLQSTVENEESCPFLYEGENDSDIVLVRLTNQKLLVTLNHCWYGAYNVGIGFWVRNDNAPYLPKLVTTAGSDFENGIIQASRKDEVWAIAGNMKLGLGMARSLFILNP